MSAAEPTMFGPSFFVVPEGVSSESDKLNDLDDQFTLGRQALASFAWRDLLLDQIADIVQTCSDRGWDGYDAEPASREAAGCAADLVRRLPDWIQTPTVVPEPDGDIAFEWRTEDNRSFSLSVTGRSLVYAGRFGGTSKQYGEEPFFETIHPAILRILAQHFAAS